jgi:hypothetical protein
MIDMAKISRSKSTNTNNIKKNIHYEAPPSASPIYKQRKSNLKKRPLN